MLSIVIPVLNQLKMTDDCLTSLGENVSKPGEVILIDNGSTEPIRSLVDKHRNLNILYIRFEENIGVNPAWNHAFARVSQPYICFLNNDTYTNKYFVKKILKTMEDPTIGITIPIREVTIDRVKDVNKDEDPRLEKAKYIEGWAFTIRRELYEKLGPVPNQFKTYMGDTYYFECGEVLGYRNIQMMNNTVWHLGARTIRDLEDVYGIKAEHKKENHLWRTIRSQLFDDLRKKYNL